jgi:hypothetical protein
VELPVPQLDDVPVVLEPDTRTTRGRHEQTGPVHGAVSLGVPIVQPVTAALAADDLPLREFLEKNGAQWSYSLVYLGCTFLPVSGSTFEKAWVTVDLGQPDAPDARSIIWSMSPMRQSSQRQISRTIKLGATVGIVEGSVEMGSDGSQTETFLQAFGLQEPSCSWEFSRTLADEIRGSFRLMLVARRPAQFPSRGAMKVSATLNRRWLGLTTYRASAAEAPVWFSI